MNKNIPTIAELEDALNDFASDKLMIYSYHDDVRDAARAMLTLLRAIEDKRWAIVPCEATYEMLLSGINMRDNGHPEHGNDSSMCYIWDAAISAAPTEAILNEMFGETPPTGDKHD